MDRKRETERHLCFDTETTGIPRDHRAPWWAVDNWPRVIELGWAIYDDAGRELSAEVQIIRPAGFRIPRAAVKVHGITTATALCEGIEATQAIDRWLAALQGQDLTLVAHNLEFDRNVLGAEMFRLGYPRGDIEALLFRRRAVCVMKSATSYCRIPGKWGRYKWPTLDELHRQLFREGVKGGHRALADVRATARCYFQLRRLEVLK